MLPIPGSSQLRRSRKLAARRGLDADLSIADWRQTCTDMDNRCVYCENLVSSWNASIDHFLPMALGGGTTITNCVLSCLFCNQRKGSTLPEIFLSHDPEKLARLQYYLSRRQPYQGDQPFWSLLIPKEEHTMMNRDQMQSTPHRLTSGTELHVYDDEQHTILQFRQPLLSETDPLASSFQVAATLTPSECIMLARTLLLYASSKIEDRQSSKPSLFWEESNTL